MIRQDYRDDSIDDYIKAVRLFLKTLKGINPSIDDAKEYHSNMAASMLARSTVNIRGAALKAFYKSQDMESELPHLKPNAKIPYFFDENDVAAILNSCMNLKHFTVLNLMFHCMLRVSDLCNLQELRCGFGRG